MRQLFAAGKRGPWPVTNDDATGPCNNGMGPHEGIPLRMSTYDASGWIWPTLADCSACGGTVARSAFGRRTA
jgi:hypothetical protein